MIDTHSHIYGPEFDEDRAEVITRAMEAGVERVLLANVDASTIQEMLSCHAQYPDFTSMAMGLHPTSVKEDWKVELRNVEDALRSGEKYLSVGEIGLDLYWDKTFALEQEKALEQQLDWAISLDLPVILHIRKAHAETFKVLSKFKGKPLRGVFHCFGGGVEEAKKAVAGTLNKMQEIELSMYALEEEQMHINDEKAITELLIAAYGERQAYYQSLIDEQRAKMEETLELYATVLRYKYENGVYRIVKPNDEKVALFCHAAFTRAWVSTLLHIPVHIMWASFSYNHTGVTVLEFRNNENGITAPQCLPYSDISHLYAEGLDLFYDNEVYI